MRDLRYLCGNLRDRGYHTGRNMPVEVLSGLIEFLRLCGQSTYNPLDNRVHCSGKSFNVCYNAIVHGAHRFGGGKLSCSAHCGGHIRRNAVHTLAEAYAHAFTHIRTDFGEYGRRGVNTEEVFNSVYKGRSPAGYLFP